MIIVIAIIFIFYVDIVKIFSYPFIKYMLTVQVHYITFLLVICG